MKKRKKEIIPVYAEYIKHVESDNPEYPARETVQLSDIRAIFKAKRIISQDII